MENKYNNNYFKEKLIKQIEKIPNKIKISLENGNLLDNLSPILI